ncbi:MAG: DNA repair protein RecO [Angelakisella sp.]|jgi:DNA repair protein RecO (recombination protein O)|nr:DNA repair protein RecO [Angelakisella sp.]
MQLGTRAVVLSAKSLEEHDRLVVLLTQDLGVVTAYAKGARRQKGTMASATEQLSYSAFQLFQNRDRTFVDKAEAETIFFSIRQDMDRLALASYFCQLCRELIPEADTQPGYLHLMVNTLTLLDRGTIPLNQLKAVFELRLLTMSGYMPDLVACAVCGDLPGEALFFAPAAGVLYCGEHCPREGLTPLVPLAPGVFQAMRHILYSDFDKLFSFRLGAESLSQLAAASEAYLLAQVERVLPALNFYKTVCLPGQ